MGGISSRHIYTPLRETSSRHHEWSRIQHIPDPGEDSDDSREAELEPGSDKPNWPKSCPVLHLDINNDFELEAQKKVMRSLYGSWKAVFWTFVLNMVSVVATQLTANVTQPTALEFSFAIAIIILFGYFLFYFRALYWAMRLESHILFVWFYFLSVVLFALYAFVIVQSLSMMSILASPLAPGSQLPVKANPIFPMITHTITLILFVLHISYTFYYVSQAFKWQFMSDEKKEKLFRKERRKGWMQKFWGKNGEDDEENNGEGYSCMLEYENQDDNKSVEESLRGVGDRLSVPGRISAESHCISFKADEPVFNHYFTLKAFYADILALKKQGKTEIQVVERANNERPEEDLEEVYTARSKKRKMAVRLIIVDMRTVKERDDLYKKVNQLWTTVRKSGDTSHADSSLRATRLRLLRQTREREGNHLLTHKDWLSLVKHVGKLQYKAGQVILEPGGYFDFLFTISEGSINVNIETSAFTDPGDMDSDSDVDVDELLFPSPELTENRIKGFGHEPGELEALRGVLHRSNCVYFTIKFREPGMGFKYMKRKVKSENEDEAREHFVVLKVKPGSQASGGHLRAGDQLVKVGSLDVEKNGITQKNLKELIKSSSFPMDIRFRRILNHEKEAVEEEVQEHALEAVPEDGPLIGAPSSPNPKSTRSVVSAAQPTIMESEVDSNGEESRTNSDEEDDDEALPKPPSVMSTMFEIGDESSDDEDGEEPLDQPQPTNPFDLASQTSDPTAMDVSAPNQYNLNNNSDNGMNLLELDFAEQMAVMDNEEDLMDYDGDDTDANTDGSSEYDVVDLSNPSRPAPVPPVSTVAPDGSISFHQYAIPRDEDDDEQVEFIGFNQPRPSVRGNQRIVPVDDDYAGDIEMVDIVVDTPVDENAPLLANERNQQEDAASHLSFERNGTVHTRVSPVAGVSGGITFWNQKNRNTMYMPLGEGEEPVPRVVEQGSGPEWPGNPEPPQPIQRRDSVTSIKSYKYRQGIIARSRTFLFGKPFGYQEVRTVSDYYNEPRRQHSQVMEDAQDDQDGASFDFGMESDEEKVMDYDLMFAGMSTFETFGRFEKGDTIGVIPWVVNHPVSVVQLVAAEDVVLHGIMIDDLTAEFNKSPSLALAFFKYLASVLGERVDRDEEKLCDKYRQQVTHSGSQSKHRQDEKLQRLLDSKPVERTSKTGHNTKLRRMASVRRNFQRKHDMEFDSLIETFDDVHAALGGNSTVKGPRRVWFGSDTESTAMLGILRPGTVYVTSNYVCFSSKVGVLRKMTWRSTPELYGKVHINDVYNMYLRDQSLVLVTGNSQLTIDLQNTRRALYLYDVVDLLRKTTSIEQAPHSYTLPWTRKTYHEQSDPSDVAFRQQKALRMEFLGLLEALQEVLSRQDKWRMFKDSRAVTLQRGQSILTASPADVSKGAPSDEPVGLYLVGKGELVIQREIYGRRIQFGSYSAGSIFGIERFLTDAPSPCTVKVLSRSCELRFCPAERAMLLLRSDPALAARFYQYSCLSYMTRVRGPVVSRPLNEADQMIMQTRARKFEEGGCVIL